jgi:hypothetical protein
MTATAAYTKKLTVPNTGANDDRNLYWGLGHAVWNYRGGDTAVLLDANGAEISRFSY